MSWYFDTSALTKLVADEPESSALAAARSNRRWRITTSDLTRTELARAALRKGSVDSQRTADLLREVDLIPVSIPVLDLAGRLEPPRLGSLDAIHLASALLLGSECEGVVTYDIRMREAAALAGLAVVSPGQP